MNKMTANHSLIVGSLAVVIGWTAVRRPGRR